MPRIALDQVAVASPCSMPWDAMTGDDQVRYCHVCKLRVYNFSDMSRAAVDELLEAQEGRLCVRLFRRTDGTILTRDCPIGWQKVRLRVQRSIAGAVALAVFAYIWCMVFLTGTGDGRRVRDIEPFRTLVAWLVPQPRAAFGTVGASIGSTVTGGGMQNPPPPPAPR